MHIHDHMACNYPYREWKHFEDRARGYVSLVPRPILSFSVLAEGSGMRNDVRDALGYDV